MTDKRFELSCIAMFAVGLASCGSTDTVEQDQVPDRNAYEERFAEVSSGQNSDDEFQLFIDETDTPCVVSCGGNSSAKTGFSCGGVSKYGIPTVTTRNYATVLGADDRTYQVTTGLGTALVFYYIKADTRDLTNLGYLGNMSAMPNDSVVTDLYGIYYGHPTLAYASGGALIMAYRNHNKGTKVTSTRIARCDINSKKVAEISNLFDLAESDVNTCYVGLYNSPDGTVYLVNRKDFVFTVSKLSNDTQWQQVGQSFNLADGGVSPFFMIDRDGSPLVGLDGSRNSLTGIAIHRLSGDAWKESEFFHTYAGGVKKGVVAPDGSMYFLLGDDGFLHKPVDGVGHYVSLGSYRKSYDLVVNAKGEAYLLSAVYSAGVSTFYTTLARYSPDKLQ